MYGFWCGCSSGAKLLKVTLVSDRVSDRPASADCCTVERPRATPDNVLSARLLRQAPPIECCRMFTCQQYPARAARLAQSAAAQQEMQRKNSSAHIQSWCHKTLRCCVWQHTLHHNHRSECHQKQHPSNVTGKHAATLRQQS